MRLPAAAALLAIAASGCLGSLSPFCEEQGAYGSWQQRDVYAGLRNDTQLDGERVYHQGPRGQTFAFGSAAYEEQTQGDGWVAYVSWWSAERRYMMRPGEAPQTGEAGTTWQVVSLEVDRAYAATYDPEEADRFLAAATATEPELRRTIVDQWLNATEEQYDRVRTMRAAVAIDLAASYLALDPTGAFQASVEVAEGPAAGAWRFQFDHGALHWSGKATTRTMSLEADALGAVSAYYRNVDRAPESTGDFQQAVRKDFAELGLPAPTFDQFVFRGPRQCAFG